jgi:hypothetical protein
MARACVFCGGSPVTQEHGLPRWMAGLFTDDIVDFSRTIQFGGQEPEVRPWRGRPFSTKVGAACASCNNGWMSQLESEVAPILTPLIRGQGARLDVVQQHLLATWAVKTMLMLRLIAGDEDASELDEDAYRWLMQQRSAPSGEQAWIAHYAADGDAQWPITFHYLAAGVAPPGFTEQPTPNAHCASFAVGHVAFALAGNRLENGPIAVQRNPPSTWRALWPVTGDAVDFPPPDSLAGNSEMQTFATPAEWRAP